MRRARNLLGRFCGWLGELLTEAERRLVVCEDCGRSAFYGEACYGGPRASGLHGH